ncbi:MAG: FKBP-type peptidyl-prolyl cis-trans isomerase [Deltaproteobacteria bacterium]|nr:FKBP-type peptidyl-prolyl cis-trans isomerase [Deltaproteobacteria bacterium]
MARKLTLKWIPVLGVLLMTAPVNAADLSLQTQKEKVSYAIGVDLARNFTRMGMDFNVDTLAKGMKDALTGDKPLMTDEELRTTLTAYQTELRDKQMKAANAAAIENKKIGDAFLAENKTKEGVVSLPSGLQYRILKVGNGKKPMETDSVECHYRGTLINGMEFDSSYKAGQPATFKVNGLIAGWTEALKLMPAGSKWQLFVPPELAYGARGAGQTIGPNSTLIFDLELIAVK